MSTVTITARPAAGRGPAGASCTAFVLAGGAALSAMQAGMVHALYERGIVPDLLVGTSAEALNAAFLASRPPTVATAGKLAAIWRGLRRSDVLPLRPATLLGGLVGPGGFFGTRGYPEPAESSCNSTTRPASAACGQELTGVTFPV